MKRASVCPVAVIAILLGLGVAGQGHAQGSPDWQAKVKDALPLLGHRNWILVVDSAYPEQNSAGIKTVETGASETDVLRDVLGDIDHSIHVRPVVYMDAELAFVPEQDAPGVTQARRELKTILGDRPVTRLLHELLLQKVEDVSHSYKVLILKTNETVPYTSVFLQLNCRYWSVAAEARLRAEMQKAGETAH